ncbi:MAG TPA: hypothetical protein VGM06_03555 [Polyangiaceae bacterium]
MNRKTTRAFEPPVFVFWARFACAVGLAAIASCSDPMPPDATRVTKKIELDFEENCPADSTWLPNTPPLRMFVPPPHPDTECPFYRGAYQNFLIAAQPLANGDPALVQYPTLDDAFVSATPHFTRNTGGLTHVPGGPAGTGRAWLGAIRQAGERQILIDRDHHTLYYGLHMNQAFVDFIQANNLETVDGIMSVDKNLSFPAGLVEFKTAWKDVDPQDFPNGVVPPPGNAYPGDPGDYSNYITTMAWIPHLHQDPNTMIVEEDPDNPVLRKMALVAIHCVYTLPGHPEFVWGSVQHVNTQAIDPGVMTFAGVRVMGAPDSQPDGIGPGGMAALPEDTDPQNGSVSAAASSRDFLLYAHDTPENVADQQGVYTNAELNFDEATQSFPGQSTPVYRMFPGSKSNDLAPDGAVFSLNSNIGALFDQAQGLDPHDKRMNYRLVAAVWLDKPAFFGLGQDGQGASFQNDSSSPLVIDPGGYPGVSEGTFCGVPLDGTHTSGDSPNASGANNTVPGCETRADLLRPAPDGTVINPGQLFQDHDPDLGGTDSPFSILGGEDRLSSAAMETFTQNGQFNNCFTCHNTKPITANGTSQDLAPNAAPLIPFAANINVSHLFSEFILREQEEAAALAAAPASGN